MVLLKHIFTRIRSTEGSSDDCSLSLLSLHALALHLAVKILLQIFLYTWRFEHVIATHLSVVFPSENASRTALCYATNTIKWKHSNIWHKSSTKHKEVRPEIETIKTIMQTTPFPRITWKVLPVARFAILKKYSIKCEKRFRLWIISLMDANVTTSHIIFTILLDNIHIVLENSNLHRVNKRTKKVVNVKFSRNTHLIETSYDRLKSREITFQQYGENLAKAGVFRWVTNIHEHKRYYYTFDNSYIFAEALKPAQIFPAKS